MSLRTYECKLCDYKCNLVMQFCCEKPKACPYLIVVPEWTRKKEN